MELLPFSIGNLLLSGMAVAGISLLWRTYRYDEENLMNRYLDRLPYLLKKPITCGLCFTFWTAFAFTILFTPLETWLPPTRFILSDTTYAVFSFIASWMVLGTLSTFVVYIIDTFYQLSHYYKHEAHAPEDKPHP